MVYSWRRILPSMPDMDEAIWPAFAGQAAFRKEDNNNTSCYKITAVSHDYFLRCYTKPISHGGWIYIIVVGYPEHR